MIPRLQCSFEASFDSNKDGKMEQKPLRMARPIWKAPSGGPAVIPPRAGTLEILDAAPFADFRGMPFYHLPYAYRLG
jgi:hypothetical protein